MSIMVFIYVKEKTALVFLLIRILNVLYFNNAWKYHVYYMIYNDAFRMVFILQ